MVRRGLSRLPLAAALAALAAGAGCDLVAGLDAVKFEGSGGSGGSGAAGGGTGGAGAATSAGGGGGEPGGSGGAPVTTSTGPVCGDGVIESGEDCDDGNDVEGDGCHACALDCGCAGCLAGTACADCPAAGQTTFKDLATKHCYVSSLTVTTWPVALSTCQSLGAGWGLGAPSTVAEMDMLMSAPGLPIDDYLAANANNRFWTGGNDQAAEGTFVWQNGEPWLAPPAGMTTESLVASDDCLVIGLTAGVVTLRGRVCGTDTFSFFCEHTP